MKVYLFSLNRYEGELCGTLIPGYQCSPEVFLPAIQMRFFLVVFVLCVDIWLLLFCFPVVFSIFRIALCSPCWCRGSRLLCFPLVCGLYVVCHGLSALPIVFISRLYSEIRAITRHLLHCFFKYRQPSISLSRNLRNLRGNN